jgi:hypothetical protein
MLAKMRELQAELAASERREAEAKRREAETKQREQAANERIANLEKERDMQVALALAKGTP